MEVFPWTLQQKPAAGAHLCLRYDLTYTTTDPDSRYFAAPKWAQLAIVS
jgi:hypothetical protein